MESVSISAATVDQFPEITTIGISTFVETFAPFNSPTQLKAYTDRAFTYEKIRSELANPNMLFYLATLDAMPVGYLKLNFADAQTELQDPNTIEIERIYVSSAFQGKQIGKLLMHKALEIAHLNGVNYVWLGVWKKNTKAIQFYESQGFKVFSEHIFQMGDEAQTDYMMRLDLTTDLEKNLRSGHT